MERETPAVLKAFEAAKPKLDLVTALYGFGATFEEGEDLVLHGRIHRAQVQKAVDPESFGGPLESNWTKTNEWIQALQEELAKAIHPICARYARELEKIVLAEVEAAQKEG